MWGSADSAKWDPGDAFALEQSGSVGMAASLGLLGLADSVLKAGLSEKEFRCQSWRGLGNTMDSTWTWQVQEQRRGEAKGERSHDQLGTWPAVGAQRCLE